MEEEKGVELEKLNDELQELVKFAEGLRVPEINFTRSATEKENGFKMFVEYFKRRGEMVERARKLAERMREYVARVKNPTSDFAKLREIARALDKVAERLNNFTLDLQ